MKEHAILHPNCAEIVDAEMSEIFSQSKFCN